MRATNHPRSWPVDHFNHSAFERSSAPLLSAWILLRNWRGEYVWAEIANFTYLHVLGYCTNVILLKVDFNGELSKHLFINLFRVVRFHYCNTSAQLLQLDSMVFNLCVAATILKDNPNCHPIHTQGNKSCKDYKQYNPSKMRDSVMKWFFNEEKISFVKFVKSREVPCSTLERY